MKSPVSCPVTGANNTAQIQTGGCIHQCVDTPVNLSGSDFFAARLYFFPSFVSLERDGVQRFEVDSQNFGRGGFNDYN